MLNGNLKNSTNWGFIEFQVLRLVKTCVIIQFCFVFDVLQVFFFELSFQIFLQKIFLEEVTSKYTTIFHIFGTFLDMLREQVLGGSMWNIRVLTVDSIKICQFLGISLFLGNLNLCNIFFRKKFPHFQNLPKFPNLDFIWLFLDVLCNFSQHKSFDEFLNVALFFDCIPSWKKWFI